MTNSCPATTATPKLGVQRGEGVVADLRPRLGDAGEEGGLPGIGQADQADIGDQLEAQPQPHLLPRPAGVGAARRLVGGGFVVRVAEAAVAALGHHHALAGGVHVVEQGLAVLGQHLGAHRHLDQKRVRRAAGAVAPHAAVAALRLEVLLVAEVDQGVEVGHRLQHHVAARGRRRRRPGRRTRCTSPAGRRGSRCRRRPT